MTMGVKGTRNSLILLAASAFVCWSAEAAVGQPTRHESVTKVTVTFTDTKFVVSRASMDVGRTAFVVLNKGRKPHILTITGPGLKGAQTTKIATGRSATLTVTLKPGAYMLGDPSTHMLYVQWLQVSPAVKVSSSGNGSVVTPITSTTGMNCD
jgi:hypothetical protein